MIFVIFFLIVALLKNMKTLLNKNYIENMDVESVEIQQVLVQFNELGKIYIYTSKPISVTDLTSINFRNFSFTRYIGQSFSEIEIID